jgi:hypothetical protein
MRDVIVLEKKEDCALITLNASRTGNTYNEDMAAALWQVVQEVRWDKNVKAALMLSDGGLFPRRGFRHSIIQPSLPAGSNPNTFSTKAIMLVRAGSR